MLSYTTPFKYEPVEVFLVGVDRSRVDKSMEEWLDGLVDRLDYGKWNCGHYHMDKMVDRVEIMFENFDVFCGRYELLAYVIEVSSHIYCQGGQAGIL